MVDRCLRVLREDLQFDGRVEGEQRGLGQSQSGRGIRVRFHDDVEQLCLAAGWGEQPDVGETYVDLRKVGALCGAPAARRRPSRLRNLS